MEIIIIFDDNEEDALILLRIISRTLLLVTLKVFNVETELTFKKFLNKWLYWSYEDQERNNQEDERMMTEKRRRDHNRHDRFPSNLYLVADIIWNSLHKYRFLK